MKQNQFTPHLVSVMTRHGEDLTPRPMATRLPSHHAAVAAWKPPSNWKPETVEAKKAEQAEKMAAKAALLDASPILCLALKTDGLAVVLNGMDESAPEVQGWLVLPCGNEAGLLSALNAILNATTEPVTEVVGHNILGFDLPKIRNAYIRNRLPLPIALAVPKNLTKVV